MIFIALLRCTEICPVIECCDFDVGLTYCMALCVIYLGFFTTRGCFHCNYKTTF